MADNLVASEDPNSLDTISGGFSREKSSEPIPVPLFRSEALAAVADNGLGRPVALLPVSWGIITTFLASMAICFVILLFIGTYTRKESAIGIVRTAGGDIPIAVPAVGIVRRI